MAYYRIYFMDGGGHIRRFKELEAGSDSDAVAFAETLAAGQKLEIWNGSRLVRRLDPDGLDHRR